MNTFLIVIFIIISITINFFIFYLFVIFIFLIYIIHIFKISNQSSLKQSSDSEINTYTVNQEKIYFWFIPLISPFNQQTTENKPNPKSTGSHNPHNESAQSAVLRRADRRSHRTRPALVCAERCARAARRGGTHRARVRLAFRGRPQHVSVHRVNKHTAVAWRRKGLAARCICSAAAEKRKVEK